MLRPYSEIADFTSINVNNQAQVQQGIESSGCVYACVQDQRNAIQEFSASERWISGTADE
jgi:hypothetical protein